MQITTFATGQTVEFAREDSGFCVKPILPPGFSLLSHNFLKVFYCILLIYIFVGISIISDIFMDSINVITAATIVVSERTTDGNVQHRQVNLWNPTVANLTLMALGSSAPEIMLNVIETVMNLGSTPGELGPSTIVGSAAFNLLVISGVSILAVDESNDERTDEELLEDNTPKGIKKIEKLSVFAITTTFSVLAYVWMFLVLRDKEVKWYEAAVTFGFFWLLILTAWIADIISAKKDDSEDGASQLPVVNTAEFIAFLLENEDKKEEEMEQPVLKKLKTLKSFLQKEFETEDVR